MQPLYDIDLKGLSNQRMAEMFAKVPVLELIAELEDQGMRKKEVNAKLSELEAFMSAFAKRPS